MIINKYGIMIFTARRYA